MSAKLSVKECYEFVENINELNIGKFEDKPFKIPEVISNKIEQFEKNKPKVLKRENKIMNNIEMLNTYLFDQLDRLNDENVEIESEVKRAGAVSKIANSILKSGELSIRATEMISEYREVKESDMPKMLRVDKDE